MMKLLRWVLGRFRMATSGLGRRLSTVFGALITMIVVAVILLNVQSQLQMVEERSEQRQSHLLDLATEVSLPYLIEGRSAELEIIYEELRKQPDVNDVFVVDADGLVLVESGPENGAEYLQISNDPLVDAVSRSGVIERQEQEHVLLIAKPLLIGRVNYGTLRLDYNRFSDRSEIARLRTRNLLAGLLFVGIGVFTSRMVAVRLVRPLNRLTVATERAADGDLEQTISVETNDEFESLATSFNTMLGALRRSIKEIHEIAYRDKLTGVPNRAWFSHELQQISVDAAGTSNEFSILFLDIDNFKSVNDSHGHHIGDSLLVQFTERLRRCALDMGLNVVDVGLTRNTHSYRFKSDVLIARLGGDEFTVIVPTAFCGDLVDAVISCMKPVFHVESMNFHTTTSIGVAMFPKNATTTEGLLKCADVAMYQAKRAGRNTYAFYDSDLHQQSLDRQVLEGEIRQALKTDQFIIFLQPQFLVQTREITGAEALIRWNHPTKGILTPDVFLPLVAGMGLLPEIGRLVVRRTLAVAQSVRDFYPTQLTFAMNLSVDELADEALVEEILWLIEGSGLPPGSVEIEITENTAMTDVSGIERQLERLHAVGARLAIDDFGVGYSNLGRLKGLEFEILKLDRSLLQDVGEDEEAENLMATVLSMAKVMHADVVAEGIETERQLAVLARYNCKFFQGYLGARPMSEEAFLDGLQVNVRGREVISSALPM